MLCRKLVENQQKNFRLIGRGEHGFLVYSKWQFTLLHIIALAT